MFFFFSSSNKWLGWVAEKAGFQLDWFPEEPVWPREPSSWGLFESAAVDCRLLWIPLSGCREKSGWFHRSFGVANEDSKTHTNGLPCSAFSDQGGTASHLRAYCCLVKFYWCKIPTLKHSVAPLRIILNPLKKKKREIVISSFLHFFPYILEKKNVYF